MKHEYTDAELQAAIDEACKEVANGPHRPMCAELALIDSEMHAWFNENDARLDLIKSALAALPEPESSLSQLRPLAEAGEVPEGCVRHYTYKQDGEWTPATKHRAMQNTHYIDIPRLPAPAEKPDPYAEQKMNASTPDSIRAVDLPRLVRLCRRHKPEGRDFRLIPQRVCWSGDSIDVCSACGMDVYDREWLQHHSEEMLEMVKPNNNKFDIVGWRYADEPTPEPLATKPISLPTPHGAISLRDWFAGQALAGLLVNQGAKFWDGDARNAYAAADAMIKEREVKS